MVYLVLGKFQMYVKQVHCNKFVVKSGVRSNRSDDKDQRSIIFYWAPAFDASTSLAAPTFSPLAFLILLLLACLIIPLFLGWLVWQKNWARGPHWARPCLVMLQFVEVGICLVAVSARPHGVGSTHLTIFSHPALQAPSSSPSSSPRPPAPLCFFNVMFTLQQITF